MGKFYDKIDSLSPNTKRKLVFITLAFVVLVGGMILYAGRKDDKQAYVPIKSVKGKEITISPNLLEKTALSEQKRKNRELEANLSKRLSRLELKEPEPEKNDTGQFSDRDPSIMNIKVPDSAEIVKYPPSPAAGYNTPSYSGLPPKPPQEKKIIGGIAVISNSNVVLQKDSNNSDIKKNDKTYYLPPSFMNAGLLTGFNALTSGRGKSNTEPLLLRIQAPAVLPNDVKARLQGCFIVGEAFGDLAKERADIRLISLSCISKEGTSVIDSKVKGFVTDDDGKVGLSGNVVSKMGASIARSAIAGIFKGIGNVLEKNAVSTSTNSLGITTGVVNTDKESLTRGAIGGGVSEGAQSLEQFYLELAKQTGPVIEVKAGKKITVVISEGVNLEVKEL